MLILELLILSLFLIVVQLLNGGVMNNIESVIGLMVDNNDDISLCDWLRNWLEVYVASSVKKRTYDIYERMIRLHILPAMGDLNIAHIENSNIQKFVNYLNVSGNLKQGGGLSLGTINLILAILKNSFERAVIVGLIKQNPCSNIIKPKCLQLKIKCFTEREQGKLTSLLMSIEDSRSFGVLLALYTGVRIGELLALTWSDVDMRKNLISITKTTYECKQADGKWCQVVDSPKTVQSTRLIPIPTAIRKMIATQIRTSKSKYVVEHNGEMMKVRTYQCYFKRLLEKNNIRVMSFHSLRHTFATRMIEIGVDVKTVSELLGHKDTVITLNRYVHSGIEQKKRAMNSLAKIINKIQN